MKVIVLSSTDGVRCHHEPCCAHTNLRTHIHTQADWSCTTQGHISVNTLSLWSLDACNFFHLYRVIILAPLHTTASSSCFTPLVLPHAVFTVSGSCWSSRHKAGSHWLKWAQAVPSGRVQPPYTPGAWRNRVLQRPRPGRYQVFTRPLMRACWRGEVGADMLLCSGAHSVGVVPTV